MADFIDSQLSALNGIEYDIVQGEDIPFAELYIVDVWMHRHIRVRLSFSIDKNDININLPNLKPITVSSSDDSVKYFWINLLGTEIFNPTM